MNSKIKSRFISNAKIPIMLALLTMFSIEAAAQNGASLKLPVGAIVTPLARDRAKELNVKMN